MSNEFRHILSISGGKDSAALAIYMKQTRNISNMEYVFMDTGQELTETYEYLDKLEGVLDCSIIRLKPEHSFNEYLKLHNNFLPSPRQRWCTVKMKIKPFEKFVGSDNVYSYIGIRADENRAGFISKKENIKPVYPFVEDGIMKLDVVRILEESGIGLPDYYKWRSRSGCYFCFFQQGIEWIGLKENHPDLFEKAKAFEKNGINGEKAYYWTKGGSIDKYWKRRKEIKERFRTELEAKKKLKPNSKLIDVMREQDSFEEAEAFDQVMKENELEEGCLVCTL